MSLSHDELAIARSVIYASLFDYPLTIDQLHQSLLESDQDVSTILETVAASEALGDILEYRDGFFFPAGRQALVAERSRREARSRALLERHHRFLTLLCALPYIRLVALSGSIAHLNLEGNGDLDLFIVTRDRHVWSVAVGVIVLARIMRCRPVVCANLILGDARLELEQQDLFTANQVIHLKPLVGGRLFQALVAANPFVVQFYPNFRVSDNGHSGFQPSAALDRVKRALERLCGLPAKIVEPICRIVYSWYLRRRSASWRSPEQVRLGPDHLKLHTQSHRLSVLERFDLAVEEAMRVKVP